MEDDPRPPGRVPGTKKRNPAYSKWYYRQNKAEIDARNRAYHKKNAQQIRIARRQYRDRVDCPALRRRRNLSYAMGRRGRPGKIGFLYFFKTVTPGFYKVGCTKNWERRRMLYGGPSTVERLYFLRPTRDMFYAETMLKMFLCEHGFRRYRTWGDWLIRDDELVFKLA
jgi:hypothetical protein